MGRVKNIILAKILTRFPRLLDRLAEKTPGIEVEGGVPWSALTRPLGSCKVAIVTTAGVHLKGQAPFDMGDSQGDPSFRNLPSDTPKDDYTITHDYYDHKDADSDINIVFPIDRLREMAKDGRIGSAAKTNYGFMGHIDGPHIETLIRKTAPECARMIKAEGVDVVLLTPG